MNLLEDRVILSKPEASEEEVAASFMKGFLLQFVNIKIYMFGITALTLVECIWSMLKS